MVDNSKVRAAHGQHLFQDDRCVCGAEMTLVEDALASKMCEIRGDHSWRLDLECSDCGAVYSDALAHRCSPRCRGKKDVHDCPHMNFVCQANIARMTDEQDPKVVVGYHADITVKCAECGKPFQFLGLEPGTDTQGARVSLDGLEARIAISPHGARPDPLKRMQFNISKFDG